jgi:hypothetical protein
LFLPGFGERLARIPPPPIFSPRKTRKTLTPHEQVEIMAAVNQGCWAPGLDLEATLEGFRHKATAEIMEVI